MDAEKVNQLAGEWAEKNPNTSWRYYSHVLTTAIRILEGAGFAVVPKEPTEAMMATARGACDYQDYIGRPSIDSLRKFHGALLRASQQKDTP